MKLRGRAQVMVAAVLVIGLAAAVALAARSLGIWVISPLWTSGCGAWTQPLLPSPHAVVVAGPTTAWMSGGLRTTDGGAHWHVVSPPLIRADAPTLFERRNLYNPPGFADFYLDANHGWEVRTFSSKSNCFDHAVAFVTSDAGRSWQQSARIQLDLSPGTTAVAAQLYFVDPHHGWLWEATGPTHPPQGIPQRVDGVLYGTSDGGFDWYLVSAGAPSKLGIRAVSNCDGPLGDVAFESIAIGWIAIDCQSTSQVAVLASRDGGATWKLEHLPTSPMNNECPCHVQRLAFFGPSQAVMSVIAERKPPPPTGGAGFRAGPYTFLLSSSDAGLTWHEVPPTPNDGYTPAIAFLDANDWWAVVTPPGWTGRPARELLYRTVDGGATWDMQNDLSLGWLVHDIYFVDSNHGWAFRAQSHPGSLESGPGVEVLTTADGGHTWKSVIAQFDF